MPIVRFSFKGLFLLSLLALAAGCGNTSSDTGAELPGFVLDVPQVVRADGGGVMTAPTVRLIVFPSDPRQGDLARLLEQVRDPSYWTATTREYGVGPLTIGATIVLDEVPPASEDKSLVGSWFRAKFDGTHADFGTPDERTIYLVVYPTPTTLSGGQECGFHGSVPIDGKTVRYAAASDCAPMTGRDGEINSLGVTISHELVESATDPDPDLSAHGYLGVDPDHVAWQFYYANLLHEADEMEIGDLCQMETATFPGASNTASSIWSNAAIRAGHDPCVPRADLPYFNAMPILTDDVQFVRSPAPEVRTKGVIVPVGQSRTIEVDLYSDRQVESPWYLYMIGDPGDFVEVSPDAADDASGVAYALDPDLRFSWDRQTGVNGDKVHLTLTRLRSAPNGSSLIAIGSKLGDDTNYWPFIVGQ